MEGDEPATVGIDERQRQLLSAYLELVYSAPSSINLTRVPRREARRRHLEEALDLVPGRDWLIGERVLDLGSGAGIPGIPLAIALPQLSITLVERNLAKAAFLLSCVERLGLDRVAVVAADAAELSRQANFEPFQVLVSRAAVPPDRLLRLARRLLRPGGEGLVHVASSLRLEGALVRAATTSALGGLRLLSSGSSTLLAFRREPFEGAVEGSAGGDGAAPVPDLDRQ